MRSQTLIEVGSPCDMDFTDKMVRTVDDFKSVPYVPCTNYIQCLRRSKEEGIGCYRRLAMEMARFILKNREPFEQAVEEERQAFLANYWDGKIWVCRGDQWQIAEGKKQVVSDIVAFARAIIDFRSGDRRPFTKDGIHSIEFGPEDAMHNAMLDLDDVYGEVGRRNPFRW